MRGGMIIGGRLTHSERIKFVNKVWHHVNFYARCPGCVKLARNNAAISIMEFLEATAKCSVCAGTRRDPMPGAEVFRNSRRR